ncbi:fungal-specific transcription factor domain-containing protein, partial [Rhizoctonia solani]
MSGKTLNLANILVEPNSNLQHFATIDIMRSVTTGLPTYFRYEVPFTLELCDQMYYSQKQGNHSAQWLYGLSEQFILLFAWINSLCETPGASENAELITWIESQISQIKIAIDESGDPMLRIGRMVVQECWRFAVMIYLYMVLCKANAYDPRVIRTQKGFMRLVRGVKPGRNPDAHLFVTMVVAGVAAHEERDRDTLRQRIHGVRECAERGTTSNDVMRGLEDVWGRTRNEGRPAVWSDLRIASLSITG